MGISDLIAGFIQEAVNEANGSAELQRAELANRFGCVPSQINYVISTRFSPEHGYIVESRRGGGGYIRIRRVRMDPKQLVMHTVNAIGESVDAATAGALLSNLTGGGALSADTAHLMAAAMGNTALRTIPPALRDTVRADIFKQMLLRLL
ncbi:MAG: CtsR family transcriptional regulator [Oscillospiraceae bacterium]|nr:CtsR family transcriptional regulator [Oscillospiraceae bacterium]